MKRVFPQIVHFENSIVKKEKSSQERLPDSQNSIVKKEKSLQERLPDSHNSIVKKEKSS
jgi:hypothetical protein